MRTVLKHIVARTYKPLLANYLSKARSWRHNDISLQVPPEVFHPRFFSSTRLLLQYVMKLPLTGIRLLELGAGSGLISMQAAKRGAYVTATDINPIAVDYLHRNSERNGVKLEVIMSDLFTSIPAQVFDIIAVNPPYYKKQPSTWIDHAWYCGENGEYFSGFFKQVEMYTHERTVILMVLCDGCDLAMVHAAATCNGYTMELVLTRQMMLEKNFIYTINKIKIN